MSGAPVSTRSSACDDCLRRSRLLAELIVPLDYCARDASRLLDVLALDDEELVAALGGRRREQLAAALGIGRDAAREPSPPTSCQPASPPARSSPSAPAEQHGETGAICRHDSRYPRRLLDPRAPRMLFASAPAGLLCELAAAPVVAIVGCTRPSDYGAEVARALAAGLASCGVTVATGARRGIGECARQAPAALGAGQLAVAPEGLCARAARTPELAGCCTLAELPHGTAGRTFGAVAAQRTLVALADVLVYVEARAIPRELLAARLAGLFDRTLAAVPGRVTSPGAAGTNSLLQAGAFLVRSAEDVLALLPGPAPASAASPEGPRARPRLEPRLATVLDRVSCGRDTADLACEGESDPGAILLALSELELLGLLVRGEAGRYVPRCHSTAAWTLTGASPRPLK